MQLLHNTGDDAGPGRRQSFCFAILFLLFLFIFTRQGIQGQNDLSRFVAVDSLIHRGTLAIDGSPYMFKESRPDGQEVYYLCDMVHYKGHFYSSKPPVFTYMIAGVARSLMALGAEIKFTGWEARRSTFALTWLVVGMLSACGVFAFRQALAKRYAAAEGHLLTVLTLCGTLFLAYSVTMNHHTPTASYILISFLLLGMDEGTKHIRAVRPAAAGFLMALATVTDCGPGFIFSIGFALYITFHMRSLRTLIFYALGAVAPLAFHWLLASPARSGPLADSALAVLAPDAFQRAGAVHAQPHPAVRRGRDCARGKRSGSRPCLCGPHGGFLHPYAVRLLLLRRPHELLRCLLRLSVVYRFHPASGALRRQPVQYN